MGNTNRFHRHSAGIRAIKVLSHRDGKAVAMTYPASPQGAQRAAGATGAGIRHAKAKRSAEPQAEA